MIIGILDSGIGGLTVARAVTDRLPDYDVLYFGDTARAPYGTKGPEVVRRFALQGARYLKSRGAGLLLIASHTVSGIGADVISQQVDIPVFESVTPTVRQALEETRRGCIGVIGSPTLVAAAVYEKRIRALRPDVRVAAASGALLIPLIEAGWLKRPETARVVKKCLRPVKDHQVDTLILACSHFPVLKKLIQKKAGSQVRLVTGHSYLARALVDFLAAHPEFEGRMAKTGRWQFEVSDLGGLAPRVADTLFGRRVILAQAPSVAWAV